MTYPAKEKVVIIIPTYNEASIIEETINQVMHALDVIDDFDGHVLVFDSASTDATVKQVMTLQKNHSNLHLRREEKKTGLGSAYRQGMHYALTDLQADIVFEFDADLSHQPKYLAPMLQEIKTCDVVVGSRYVKGGHIPKNWGFHRKLFSVLGNYVARVFLTSKYKDFTSGFRASRSSVLKKNLPRRFISNHYAYKLHLLWLLHQSGATIREYPITFVDRTTGESKLPKNSIIDSLRVVFTLRFLELKRYFKMCLVGALGLVVQFIVYNWLRKILTPFHASQAAVAAAIINNFLLNSCFTFKNRTAISLVIKAQRLLRFVMYSLMMIFLQSYWLYLGMRYVGSGSLPENILLAVGIGLGSLLNYFIYSRHIWPETQRPSPLMH